MMDNWYNYVRGAAGTVGRLRAATECVVFEFEMEI